MADAELSRTKKLVFWACLVLTPVLVLEVGARVILAFEVGPSVLAYGTGLERRVITTSGSDESSGVLVRQYQRRAHEGGANGVSERGGKKRGGRKRGVHTVSRHGNAQRGYSKYFPNQVRLDSDPVTGETFEVTINRAGFRGEDWSAEKAADQLRVVTLGASSTFGYFNRDADTYPAQLEGLLAARCERPVEVINLGIPHLDSHQIRSLFDVLA